jgi:hypothetical protein
VAVGGCFHRRYQRRSLPADFAELRVAGLDRVAGRVGVVASRVEVRVDLKRDAGIGVAELAADEDDVEAFGDQE